MQGINQGSNQISPKKEKNWVLTIALGIVVGNLLTLVLFYFVSGVISPMIQQIIFWNEYGQEQIINKGEKNA